MSLCDFIIIGAMKAGTTSLYNDLCLHPNIYFPEQKEPEVLLDPGSKQSVVRKYEKLMKRAPVGSLKGEASTGYTKLPDSAGCAERALDVLGPQLRLIYLMRDPVQRAISHYRHRVLEGSENRAIDEALLDEPKYVDYGRYDWQLKPWIQTFGQANLLTLSFEEYCTDRDAVLRKVCTFLDIDVSLFLGQDAKIYNSSDNKYVATGLGARIIASDFFQSNVKPLFPRSVRRAVMPMVTKRAKPTDSTIQKETAEELTRRFGHRSRAGSN